MDVVDDLDFMDGGWGTLPTTSRQEALCLRLWTWLEGSREERPPFSTERLSGADVFFVAGQYLSWLLPRRGLESFGEEYLSQLVRSHLSEIVDFEAGDLTEEWAEFQNSREAGDAGATFLIDPEHPMLEGLDMRGIVLIGADLRGGLLDGIDLRGADLTNARLERASLRRCRLQGAYLDHVAASSSCFRGAVMTDCFIRLATFAGADLRDADMAGSVARGSRFDAANLGGASLVSCKLTRTSFSSAELFQTRFAHSRLLWANFGPVGADSVVERALYEGGWLGFVTDETPEQRLQHAANLSLARFDAETELNDVALWSSETENPQLADIVWGDVNLTVVRGWSSKSGDESRAERRNDSTLFERAARTNRQLAVQLRRQGMTDASDFYGYRAKLCELRAFRLDHAYVRYIGSGLLGGLCGWGFRPARTVLWYLAILLSCWAGYVLTVPHLSGWQDLILSVSSFHGRGVFVSSLQSLSRPASAVVIVEAVLGLLIEATFVATFTQRFLAR